MNFLVGHRKVLDASGNDQEFAFANQYIAVAEAHTQHAFDDQKQFVLVIVTMPDKLALDLDRLDVAIVEFADDAGMPMILEFREFLGEIYGVHVAPYSCRM